MNSPNKSIFATANQPILSFLFIIILFSSFLEVYKCNNSFPTLQMAGITLTKYKTRCMTAATGVWLSV